MPILVDIDNQGCSMKQYVLSNGHVDLLPQERLPMLHTFLKYDESIDKLYNLIEEDNIQWPL